MSRTLEGRDITTRLVHAGERQPPPRGLPVSTPIYATSTFTYGSMAEVDRVFSGEDAGYVYTRYGNPTTGALAGRPQLGQKTSASLMSAWQPGHLPVRSASSREASRRGSC